MTDAQQAEVMHPLLFGQMLARPRNTELISGYYLNTWKEMSLMQNEYRETMTSTA
jgi:hypothetical protein